MTNKTIYYFDSMLSEIDNSHVSHKKCEKLLGSKFAFKNALNEKIQYNSYDCGMFVLGITECLINYLNEKEFNSNAFNDVNFDDLLKVNNHTKGWIQVKGTNINYPFVQTKDNDYYLNRSYDKSYNKAGWVFLDFRNKYTDNKNTIIYAHGRTDTTMFGSLKNILKSDWLDNKDNYVVKISTPEENTLWQVFSVYHIKTTSDYIRTDFDNDEDFLKFTKMLTERSKYNFNVEILGNDQILTLSTCYNDFEKMVMHAKLIKRSKK